MSTCGHIHVCKNTASQNCSFFQVAQQYSNAFLFDTQCFQLVEYVRLTAKYYELMFVCVTMIRSPIHHFHGQRKP
jgi:hypothetical protein